jgi:hypothetical protein
VVTSLIALVGGVSALRPAHTRAVGAVVAVLAIAGVLRPIAWEASAFANVRGSPGLLDVGAWTAAGAVVAQGAALLFAAAWLATRSLWRGRVLANAAVIASFALTYLAVRGGGGGPESEVLAALRNALAQTASAALPLPYGFATIAAFLMPASVLLAVVALVQRPQPATLLVPLALALVSNGTFDVPLQALAAVAATAWLMLGMTDDRALWSSIARGRRASP